jgi:hypothetical protein
MEKIMDQKEDTRRALVRAINVEPGSRETLEIEHGQIWDTDQLCQDCDIKGFMASFVIVRRKSDGKVGSLLFQHSPRFYFAFKAD